jgi:hypothetical protein
MIRGKPESIDDDDERRRTNIFCSADRRQSRASRQRVACVPRLAQQIAASGRGGVGTPPAIGVGMRTLFLMTLAASVACDSSVGELSIDLVASDNQVVVHARELANDCTCTSGEWPAAGTCEGWSDGIVCTCTPPPASCLERVSLVRGDDELASIAYDPFFGGGEVLRLLPGGLLAGDVEVVLEGCDAVARVPIEPSATPEVSFAELDIADDGTRVEWTTDGPAIATAVSISGGLSSIHCLLEPDGSTFFDGFAAPISARLHSFDVMQKHDEPIGEVRVWAGTVESLVIDPPPSP